MPDEVSLPPHSVELEQAILNAVIQDPRQVLETSLKPSDFFMLVHRWIWEVVAGRVDRGESTDYIAILEELRAIHPEVNWSQELFPITNSDWVIRYDLETYARLLQVTALRRRLLGVAGNLAKLAGDTSLNIDQVIEAAEQDFREAVDGIQDDEMVHISQIAGEYFKQVERVHESGAKTLGISTGFPELDRLTSGLQDDTLTIIGARPGVGKTAALVNMGLSAANAGHGILLYSMEMSKFAVNNRAVSQMKSLHAQRLSLGDLSEEEWSLFIQATAEISNLPIWIDPTVNLTIEMIKRKTRRAVLRNGVRLVLIDYLQLITGSGRESRYEQVGMFSRELKKLAGELHIPILAAAQLSRGVEQRADKRPQLSDLRESGNIEQDADVVILLHREDMYNDASIRPNQTDFIVAKNRAGAPGTVSLYYKRESMKFGNMTRVELDNYAL